MLNSVNKWVPRSKVDRRGEGGGGWLIRTLKG